MTIVVFSTTVSSCVALLPELTIKQIKMIAFYLKLISNVSIIELSNKPFAGPNGPKIKKFIRTGPGRKN